MMEDLSATFSVQGRQLCTEAGREQDESNKRQKSREGQKHIIPESDAIKLRADSRCQPAHDVRRDRVGEDVDMQLPLLLGRDTVHVAGVNEVLGIIISSKGVR